MSRHKISYGIDAPLVVYNLFIFSIILFFLAALSFKIESLLWFWLAILYTFPTALSLGATGCWMLYGIRIAKPKIIRKLIQDLNLNGKEQILDLGCGSGLLLIEAAKHVPKGKVYGIDLWKKKDQSGNSKEKTLENVFLEGVSNRVEIQTADFRALPFADAMFDVVVSSLAIHNLSNEKERERVLLEMLRVLKPGGKFAVLDINHTKQYEQVLSKQRLTQLNCSKKNYTYCPPIQIVSGKK